MWLYSQGTTQLCITYSTKNGVVGILSFFVEESLQTRLCVYICCSYWSVTLTCDFHPSLHVPVAPRGQGGGGEGGSEGGTRRDDWDEREREVSWYTNTTPTGQSLAETTHVPCSALLSATTACVDIVIWSHGTTWLHILSPLSSTMLIGFMHIQYYTFKST